MRTEVNGATKMKKLLCHIGIHNFKEVTNNPKGNGSFQYCKRCNKKQLIIYAVMESDLKSWRDKGEITNEAYEQALEQGYYTKE